MLGRRPALVPLLLVVLAGSMAAGCLDPEARGTEGSPELDAGRVVLAGVHYNAGEPAQWEGRWLATAPEGSERCLPDNCERIPFRLEGSPSANASVLQSSLIWSPDGNTGDTDPAFPNFDLRILTATGQEIARSEFYKFSAHILLHDWAPGDYVAEVRIRHLNPESYMEWVGPIAGLPDPPGEYPNPVTVRGSYRGVLLLADPSAPVGGDLLPDLVVHTMRDLRLSYAPMGQGHAGPPAVVTVEMPTAPGCTDDEYVEGARRCLRFSVGLGNAGLGPLELGYNHTDTSRATEEQVPAAQCVTRADGSGTVRSAGTGSYHIFHGHDHQQDILSYDLYTYDEATGLRGETLRQGEKFGYGFFRQGLVDEGRALAWPADVPSQCGGGFGYYLHPGWFDVYMYWRTGQFIDISGVPDGTYVLAATVNPAGDILESDTTNNEATVAFRLTGNEVTVIEPWQFAR